MWQGLHARPRDPSHWARLATLKAELGRTGALVSDVALERWLLLRMAGASLERVAALPVSPDVQRLFLEEFTLYAAPDKRRSPLLALGTPTFRAACEVASLARFPAGQLHWDVSGLERRALLRVPTAQLPRVLTFVAARMRGFGPAYFSHVNGLRRNPFVWVETESNKSYYRMARSLERQPEMLGLVTRAWFHDPDLEATSPHLAWTNRVFTENGGIVVANGKAESDAGFLANNTDRQAAYERGEYRPKYGLVLWPRAAMIAWANRHPELADSETS